MRKILTVTKTVNVIGMINDVSSFIIQFIDNHVKYSKTVAIKTDQMSPGILMIFHSQT